MIQAPSSRRIRLTLDAFPGGWDIDQMDFMARLALPPDEHHPVLVNAIMLLATWFASPQRPLPPGTPPAEYFFAQVRRHIGESLQGADRLTSHLAASAFLSFWLISNGRFLEGQYEISATARLAVDCGLHQIDEDVIMGVMEPQPDLARPPAYGILGAPKNVEELRIRIVTFWAASNVTNHQTKHY